MLEKRKLLNPKLDIVFHSLFRVGNEDITKSIISAITKEKIKEINLNNDRIIIPNYIQEKGSVLDLKATLDDGVLCNIEIQLADNKDTAERFLYYWSRIYTSQLKKGEDYKKLNKVISIIILNYKYEKTKEIDRIHTKWKIKELLTGKNIELTDVLELHILEIPKAKDIIKKEPNNELAQWMMFLDDPNNEGVLEIMEKNEEIKKAMFKLEEISSDEEMQRLAELREKWLHDKESEESYKREFEKSKIEAVREIEKGKKEVEKGKKEVEEGKKEVEEGKKEVEEAKRKMEEIKKEVEEEKNELEKNKKRFKEEIIEEKFIIAKKMKEKNIPIKEIIEITKLTKEQIESL